MTEYQQAKATYPHRVQILQQGAKLTDGPRNASYGEPVVNLGFAGFLKRVFWANATRQMSDAEHEAIDNVLQKLARVGTGSGFHEDNYVDGATYFAIAGEVAALAENAMQGQKANEAVAKALSSTDTHQVEALGKIFAPETPPAREDYHRVAPSTDLDL